MRTLIAIFALTILAMPSVADDSVTQYTNAVFWDGEAEQRGSLFVRGDRFVVQPDTPAGKVVDLDGAIVTAPFAEGHNHNVVDTIFTRANEEYLQSGIFYVKVPTTHPPSIASIEDALAQPGTVDVIYSMGGITSVGGHPVALFVNTLSKTLYGGATYEDFAGQAFHEVENTEQVALALDRIRAHGAHFVKATLIYSEDYLDENYDGQPLRGLHPDLLPVIVREAHARGLPVTLHASSAFDYRVGVSAGVDEIAHLPGLAWPPDRAADDHRLTAADAQQTKDAGIAVVTTTYVIDVVFRNQPEQLATFKAMQRANIDVLKAADVELRIGSDTYDREGTGVGANPTRGEVENLVAMGAFEPREALERWIDTGRRMFPERRIACFEPGCEASFLVFGDDPRREIENLHSLEVAVKQGEVVVGSFD